MEVRIIEEEPKFEQFLPREEYEAQTPATFQQFDTSPSRKPVIYNHVPHADLVISEHYVKAESLLGRLASEISDAQDRTEDDGEASSSENLGNSVHIPVSLWVNSDNLTIFSARRPYGIQVPYEFIAHHGYHAIDAPNDTSRGQPTKSFAILIEMTTHDRTHDMDDDEDALWPSFNVIPKDENNETSIKALYQAIADCMDLHPDPQSPDVDNEGPLPALGSGTWITAENMDDYAHEFADTSEALGPGAGTVHARDDDADRPNGAGLNGEHAHGEEEEETKWQRTD